MGRSLRKGPFIAYHLLEKVREMNSSGKKKTITKFPKSSPASFVFFE